MKIKKTKFFTLFISSFFLFALTGTTQAVDYYVPTTTSTVDGDTFCGGVACTSADKIIIRGGARSNLSFQNFNGNGSYITITNESSNPDKRVVITTSNAGPTWSGLELRDCKYVDLRGNNDPDLMYGIKVIYDGTQVMSSAIRVRQESDHIKISYTEIDDVTHTTTGILVLDNTLSSAWIFDTFEIHHNYIHDIGYAGMYLGQNDPHLLDNPYIANFSVHDNLLEDMGCYGITLKGVHESSGVMKIYNNTVRRTGVACSKDTTVGSFRQGIGTTYYEGDTYAEIYGNRIEHAIGPGLSIKYGPHKVYDNLILGCGTLNHEKWGHGIYTYNTKNPEIYDNIIIQSGGYGIYTLGSCENVKLFRNLVGEAGNLIGWAEKYPGDLIEGTGADANIYHANVADFNFNAWSDDGDYSNDDFGLSATPPADHNWYFSMSGGGDVCSEASPCKWLSSNQVGYVEGQTTAQNKIDSVGSDKTVNLYFKRGDVWNINTGQNKVFIVSDSNPMVNINAYGSGARPIFDGNIVDFSTAEVSGNNGYNFFTEVFVFRRNNCSMQNIEIKRIYGTVIRLGSSSNTSHTGDYFTLSNCYIHHIGYGIVAVGHSTGANNCTVEYNTMHTAMELYRYSKVPFWAGAINFFSETVYPSKNNLVRYNVMYDIYGEGITAHGGTIEYNIVGDTGSIGIYPVPTKYDASDTIVRYNFVIQSNSPIYKSFIGSSYGGIYYFDENSTGGDNSNATIEIYGNVVINRSDGIKIYNGDGLGEIRVFNNTIIDSDVANLIVDHPDEFVAGYVYNNTSILYDNTSSIHGGYSTRLPHPNWTVSNNHFWTTGGLPTVDDGWQTNMITTDPKLTGELAAIDWDGQSGPTYYKDIKFSDVIPLAGSSLIGSGKTLDASYSKIFLTQGTNFDTLPNIPNFMLSSQTDGSWDVGAVEVGGTTVSTCLTEGYQCCSSCQSGPHSEYDSDCFGGICCETCSIPLPPIPTPDPTCADSGTCCPAGQLCSGIGKNLPGCENVCCTGGTCIDPPASAVCQYKGYQCCNSCKLDPQPDYDSTCPGAQVCCVLCTYDGSSSTIHIDNENPVAISNFKELIENSLNWILGITGSLALLILIGGGVMYMGVNGDEQKITQAKRIILYAVIGLTIILLSYSIILVLSGILT